MAIQSGVRGSACAVSTRLTLSTSLESRYLGRWEGPSQAIRERLQSVRRGMGGEVAELGWPLRALAFKADDCSSGRLDARNDEGEVGEGGAGILMRGVRMMILHLPTLICPLQPLQDSSVPLSIQEHKACLWVGRTVAHSALGKVSFSPFPRSRFARPLESRLRRGCTCLLYLLSRTVRGPTE